MNDITTPVISLSAGTQANSYRYGWLALRKRSRYCKKSRNERRESRRIIFVAFFSIAVRKVSSRCPVAVSASAMWLLINGAMNRASHTLGSIPIVLDWTLATISHKYNSSVFSLFFLGLSQGEYHFSRIKDSQIHTQWLVILIGRDFVFNLSHGFSFSSVPKCMKPCHVYFCTLATPFNRWWTLTFCYFL